jgi:hypothetical protein
VADSLGCAGSDMGAPKNSIKFERNHNSNVRVISTMFL